MKMLLPTPTPIPGSRDGSASLGGTTCLSLHSQALQAGVLHVRPARMVGQCTMSVGIRRVGHTSYLARESPVAASTLVARASGLTAPLPET
eukprot:241316-Chlamydomonas_euryale.AAC.1